MPFHSVDGESTTGCGATWANCGATVGTTSDRSPFRIGKITGQITNFAGTTININNTNVAVLTSAPFADLQAGLLRVCAAHPEVRGDIIDLFTPQGHVQVARIDPLAQVDQHHAGSGRLTALMPGKVIALLVKPGQTVKQGDALAVTEAMKMEHTLTAPQAGTVASILCAVGDQVAEGAELLRIE